MRNDQCHAVLCTPDHWSSSYHSSNWSILAIFHPMIIKLTRPFIRSNKNIIDNWMARVRVCQYHTNHNNRRTADISRRRRNFEELPCDTHIWQRHTGDESLNSRSIYFVLMVLTYSMHLRLLLSLVSLQQTSGAPLTGQIFALRQPSYGRRRQTNIRAFLP